MDFIDLKAQQLRIREAIEDSIKKVLDHGKYIMGPEIQELEALLANYANRKYAVTCSSGTDALILALMALGIKKNDAVLTTPFTFVATAEAVAILGATPVFVDIEEDTLNLNPVLLPGAFAQSISKGLVPKAIITVDIFGLPCAYKEIKAFSTEKQLVVVEDAAQSFGATYLGGRACALGDIGCTSFFPAKPLGCYGDGGAVFTDDDNLREVLVSLRVHGQGRDKYENVRIGLNARMDTIQAAILIQKLKIFDEELKMRQVVAERYLRLLAEYAPEVKPQRIPEGVTSAWAQFTILFPTAPMRDKAMEALNQRQIPTAIYYPTPLHLQRAFSHLGYQKGDFPVTEDVCQRVLSLPMHPYLDEKDQVRIVEIIGDSIRKAM